MSSYLINMQISYVIRQINKSALVLTNWKFPSRKTTNSTISIHWRRMDMNLISVIVLEIWYLDMWLESPLTFVPLNNIIWKTIIIIITEVHTKHNELCHCPHPTFTGHFILLPQFGLSSAFILLSFLSWERERKKEKVGRKFRFLQMSWVSTLEPQPLNSSLNRNRNIKYIEKKEESKCFSKWKGN